MQSSLIEVNTETVLWCIFKYLASPETNFSVDGSIGVIGRSGCGQMVGIRL